MIATVQIGGEQIRVEKGKTFIVNRLNEDSGKKISFKDVFLIEDKGSIQLGNPKIENATVSASILEHFKGEKVIVFKKKRRKGYKVKNGHRQYLTKIKIDDISLDKKKVTIKKESAKITTSKVIKKSSSSEKIEKKEISKPKAK